MGSAVGRRTFGLHPEFMTMAWQLMFDDGWRWCLCSFSGCIMAAAAWSLPCARVCCVRQHLHAFLLTTGDFYR